jgi:hypothetical protein
MTRKPLAYLSVGIWMALLYAASAAGAAGVRGPVSLTPAQLRPRTEALYQTKPMNGSRRGEDKRIVDHGVLIHYMSDQERENARVVIVDGELYTASGEPTPFGRGGEKLNYVMDAAGNFYIFDQTGHPDLRHSSFFDGGPVACAGDLVVKNGRIVKINHNSGHYSPSSKMFQNVLTELKKDGVDLSDAGA